MPAKALSLLMATVLGIAPMCAEAQPVPGAWRHGPPGHWRGGPPRGPGRWGPPGRWHRPPPVWRPGYRYWGGDPWISNWQAYPGLYAPPYGYRWVRSGNQFLLTAIATGMISAVVAGAMVGPYR
ncbi:RcnB family protein [Acetobacter fallax]|uniref:Integral membrane protein n=1 Tax=Acetobacter fallax TaxID=1737473 RepID=A0ABX0KAA4_9PROT|nr:RcnB family protein [Acetobacter fallax]NHO32697.1 hypothetical protein [Acetobacter fallax]NHO36243.1 hypothetical protein [Acetobacter fallax]